MSTGTCSTCRYYVEAEIRRSTEEPLGNCCRYPPTVCGVDDDAGQYQATPVVWASDFCGEWAAKLAS